MLPDKRRLSLSLVIFTLVYAGLSQPAPDLGRAVARVASHAANRTIGGDALARDLDVRFEPAVERPSDTSGADRAWMVLLRAERYPTGAHAEIHFDLRRAFWVPLAVFFALMLASPIWQSMRGPIVLVTGVLALQIPFALSALINAVALMYENYVIDLSENAQSAVRFGYALLAPPGMVYAIPLLLWAALLHVTRLRPWRSEPLAQLISASSQ